MKARKFEQLFDAGVDLAALIDVFKARRNVHAAQHAVPLQQPENDDQLINESTISSGK
jgi:hypothetical protein